VPAGSLTAEIALTGLASGSVTLTAGSSNTVQVVIPVTVTEALPTLAAAKTAGAVTLNYGIFVNAVLDFLIVAFAIFLLIKQVNRFKKKEEPAAPAPVSTKECPQCLSVIPLKAKRCAHCTTQLEPAQAAAGKA